MASFGRYASQRPPDAALSRRCLLRLIGGVATLQIPTIALAGFDFFLSEYSATRAELQAEMAGAFRCSNATRNSSP
jgi:hypothetical protein